jgi:hypothetical protein
MGMPKNKRSFFQIMVPISHGHSNNHGRTSHHHNFNQYNFSANKHNLYHDNNDDHYHNIAALFTMHPCFHHFNPRRCKSGHDDADYAGRPML